MAAVGTNSGEYLVLIFVPFLALAAIYSITRATRFWPPKTTVHTKSVLDAWVAEQHAKLVECEATGVGPSPFRIAINSQTIYRIGLEYADGSFVRAWVRCNSSWILNPAERVEVRWDPQTPKQPGFPVVLPDQNQRQ